MKIRFSLGVALGALVLTAACASPDTTSAVTTTSLSTTTTTAAGDATTQEETGEAAGTATDASAAGEDALPDPLLVDYLHWLVPKFTGYEDWPLQQEYGPAPFNLPAGRVVTDSLGTEISFETDGSFRLVAETGESVRLVARESSDLTDGVPVVAVVRPHVLYAPGFQIEGAPKGLPAPYPRLDFDSWFNDQPALVVEATDAMFGDSTARRYDIEWSEDSEAVDSQSWGCMPAARCLPFFGLVANPVWDLSTNRVYRLWVVPQGDEWPIVVVASTERVDDGDSWAGYEERIDTISESFEVGPARPSSLDGPFWELGAPGYVPAGRVWLPIAGGVEFDLDAERRIAQFPNWSMIHMEDEEFTKHPPNVELAVAVSRANGIAIESAEALADHMVDVAGAVRLDDAEVAGLPAKVVRMEAVTPGILAFTHLPIDEGTPSEYSGWRTQDFVELWAIDTDNGILILTAEADSAEGFEASLGLLQRVRESLVIH